MTSLALFQQHVDHAGVHPNGPVVFIRARPDGGQDRLHWWAGRRPWSNRHNHRWSFTSECWYGELEEELLTPLGEGGQRHEPDGSFTDIGPVEWTLSASGRVRVGSQRYLHLDQIHRVRPLIPTITFVRTEPAARNWSRVLPGPSHEATRTGPFVVYTKDDVNLALKRIEEILR